MTKKEKKDIGMTKKIALATTAVAASTQSVAYDWSTVTGGIDFSGEIAGVAAVVGLLATVLVVMKGGKMILGMIRG